MNDLGETSNGRCSTTISALADGRLRLDEAWAWESKPGAGTSASEEIMDTRPLGRPADSEEAIRAAIALTREYGAWAVELARREYGIDA